MSDPFQGRKLLLDTAFDGMRTSVQFNEDGTRTYFHEYDSQAMSDILERNKALANDGDGYSRSRELRRVATIPNWLMMKWRNEEGWDPFDPNCKAKLFEKLDSSEYMWLRTAPGRLGKPKE